MSKEKQIEIEVITYEQDRLNYFTDLMEKAQKKYKRLFKRFKDAPYLSEEAQILSDAGRETHFYGDVVEMLEKGYRKQSEWISVEERLPDRSGRFLVYTKRTHSEGVLLVNYTPKYTFGEKSLMGRAVWFSYDSEWGDYEIEGVTHWMPLPEAPKKGGE